jgi:DNA polymerase-1
MSARNIYVPHDGFWFLEADFKQIELRICAALSGDEALLRALDETDPFAVIMDQLGVDRVRAKNLMYGTIYGAGPRKLAQTLRAHGFVITEAECKALQNQVARAYPKLRVWREAIIKRVKVTYEIVNPFGLRRFFYDRSSCVPAALNVTPQSTAGMIIWHSLAPLEMTVQACNGYLVNTVHDNFLMEFPLTISHERASSMVADVLEREWPQIAPGFRVPVEFKYGDAGTAWGELRAIQ